jgi:hypothetical protein
MDISLGAVVALILGLTEWIKTKAGLSGTAAEWLALGVGSLIGSAYQFTVTKPIDVSQWIVVIIAGLIISVSTTGGYKLGMSVADRVNNKNIGFISASSVFGELKTTDTKPVDPVVTEKSAVITSPVVSVTPLTSTVTISATADTK